MWNTIKASLYKLFKDRPFKITLIVGISLAIALTLLYCLAIPEAGYTGYTMLLTASSPTSNFGLAIPINLVVFIVGEFNYGTIRNKIIAGNKKFNIYLSLFVTGIVFSLVLIFAYVLVATGLATILSGFLAEGQAFDGGEFALMVTYMIMTYVMVTSLAVFAATSIRHIGGSITVCVLTLIFAFLAAFISYLGMALGDEGGALTTTVPAYMFILNPLFSSSISTSMSALLGNVLENAKEGYGYSIISTVIYTAIFFALGVLIFNKRDVK